MRSVRARDALLPAAIVLLLASLWGVVRPTGDFPLNDDWQYAHVAKRLAETGDFVVDVPVAPTLALQSAAGAAVIRAFGFSHVRLRALTVVTAGVLLLLLDRLLAMAGAGLGARFAQLGLVALNPLFLNLTFSFMTEVYGAAVAFVGVWIWYRSVAAERAGRARRGRWGRWLAALVVGASFWVRQFAVLAFPALALARLVAARRGGEGATRREVRALAIDSLVFLLPIALYFAWAESGVDRLNPLFTRPLGRSVTRPAFAAHVAQTPVFVLYMTAFLLPLLLAVAAAGWRRWLAAPRRRLAALAVVATLALSALAAAHWGGQPRSFHPYLQRHFPLLSNIVLPYGVGPVELTGFPSAAGEARPAAQAAAWVAFEILLVALGWTWLELARRGRSLQASVVVDAGRRAMRAELVVFGAGFALLSFLAAVQVFRFRVFDRYFFPSLLGLTLAAVLLPATAATPAAGRPRRLGAAGTIALSAALLGGLSVAAVHDHFRWNEARWSLLARGVARGVPAAQIDGGFEVNGWLEYEGDPPRAPSRTCGRRTRWSCFALDYVITFAAPPGGEVVLREPIDDRLGNLPDLLLVRRPPR
jgi:hypothetical protein